MTKICLFNKSGVGWFALLARFGRPIHEGVKETRRCGAVKCSLWIGC